MHSLFHSLPEDYCEVADLGQKKYVGACSCWRITEDQLFLQGAPNWPKTRSHSLVVLETHSLGVKSIGCKNHYLETWTALKWLAAKFLTWSAWFAKNLWWTKSLTKSLPEADSPMSLILLGTYDVWNMHVHCILQCTQCTCSDGRVFRNWFSNHACTKQLSGITWLLFQFAIKRQSKCCHF